MWAAFRASKVVFSLNRVEIFLGAPLLRLLWHGFHFSDLREQDKYTIVLRSLVKNVSRMFVSVSLLPPRRRREVPAWPG